MAHDVALLRSVLVPIAGRSAVVLVLAAMLVALVVSVLIPTLSDPALSPTRWYARAM